MTETDTTQDDVTDDGGASQSDATPAAGVMQAVAEGIKSALDELGIRKRDETSDDDEEDEVKEPQGSHKSAAAVEDETEDKVRKALAGIRREEETEKRIGALETKTAEKPPVKERRLTRALWGSSK